MVIRGGGVKNRKNKLIEIIKLNRILFWEVLLSGKGRCL